MCLTIQATMTTYYMAIRIDATQSLADWVPLLQDIQEGPDSPVLLLVSESHAGDIPAFLAAANAAGLSLLGGMFPGLIYGQERFTDGAIGIPLPAGTQLGRIGAISEAPIEVGQLKMPSEQEGTALILVDGLAANINLLLSTLYNVLGNTVNYIGGGAGSLSLVQQACVFDADGFYEDSAVIAWIPETVCLGVQHGWQQINGPFVATKTHRNVIQELNWQNAFSIYQDTILADSGQQIRAEDFFEIAKGYPFGLYKEQGEDIVRDPIATNEAGELICVGEVPAHSVLNILKGNPQSLVKAAQEAARLATAAAGKRPTRMLLVDCISRVLFLEDQFSDELAAVNETLTQLDPSLQAAGMLSLGEISSSGEGWVEFLNKTMVVGLFS